MSLLANTEANHKPKLNPRSQLITNWKSYQSPHPSLFKEGSVVESRILNLIAEKTEV